MNSTTVWMVAVYAHQKHSIIQRFLQNRKPMTDISTSNTGSSSRLVVRPAVNKLLAVVLLMLVESSMILLPSSSCFLIVRIIMKANALNYLDLLECVKCSSFSPNLGLLFVWKGLHVFDSSPANEMATLMAWLEESHCYKLISSDRKPSRLRCSYNKVYTVKVCISCSCYISSILECDVNHRALH